MRICLVSEYFYPDNTGGTGTVLSQLLNHFSNHYPDIEIDVITSRNLYRGDEELLPVQEMWNGIRILRVGTPKAPPYPLRKRLMVNTRFSIAALRKLLGNFRKYDLVIVSTAPPPLPLAAKVFKNLTGTPYIYLIYDLYPDIALALNVIGPSKATRLIQKLQKGWMQGAAKTVVLGRCMKDYLTQNYQLSPDKIAAIPVGSDAKKIVPQDKNSRFRAHYDLQGFVVLWAGNFGQHQNFDAIIDSAKLLTDNPHQITFVFVGDGAQKDYIAARIIKEEITNARLLPFVSEEDFSDMLASADVSLVSLESGAEGLGVPSKFYNILASGRPTVALVAPTSEVACVLEEENCGVRVEQGNALQLAEAISHLANSPELLQRMGANARRACEERYSIEHIAHQFYEVFLAAQRDRPTQSRDVDSLPVSETG